MEPFSKIINGIKFSITGASKDTKYFFSASNEINNNNNNIMK